MIIDSKETKERILAKFLSLCEFEGWNNQTLKTALQECDIDEKYLELIFENGCLSLADFYIESQNQAVIAKIAEMEGFESKKIRDKITIFLKARFEVEKGNQIALSRLMHFYLNPQNFTSCEMGPRPMIYAMKSCYSIADTMWFGIKDQSTDFNFYTKRLTLSKIILRTLFTFLKDESSDLAKTYAVIDVEIAKVMKFEKRKAQIKKFANDVFLNKDNHAESCTKIKRPKEVVADFVKDLPFIRLMKFKK